MAPHNGEGRFGRLSVVKMANKMRSTPESPFSGEPVNYSNPDGLIIPLVYGLKALMQAGPNGHLHWKLDPVLFLEDHLEPIVRKYRVILDAFRADPQKVGKNEGWYDLVLDAYEAELLKRGQEAA